MSRKSSKVDPVNGDLIDVAVRQYASCRRTPNTSAKLLLSFGIYIYRMYSCEDQHKCSLCDVPLCYVSQVAPPTVGIPGHQCS